MALWCRLRPVLRLFYSAVAVYFLVAVYGGAIGEHRFREIVGEQWFRPGRGFRPTKSGNFTDS